MTNERRVGVVGGIVRKHGLPIPNGSQPEHVLRWLKMLDFKRVQVFHLTADTVSTYMTKGSA